MERAHADLLAALNASWHGSSGELAADVAKDMTEQILHALWAASLTSDPRAIPETVWWISSLLQGRNASSTLEATLRQTQAQAVRDYPLTTALLTTSWPAIAATRDGGVADDRSLHPEIQQCRCISSAKPDRSNSSSRSVTAP